MLCLISQESWTYWRCNKQIELKGDSLALYSVVSCVTYIHYVTVKSWVRSEQHQCGSLTRFLLHCGKSLSICTLFMNHAVSKINMRILTWYMDRMDTDMAFHGKCFAEEAGVKWTLEATRMAYKCPMNFNFDTTWSHFFPLIFTELCLDNCHISLSCITF